MMSTTTVLLQKRGWTTKTFELRAESLWMRETNIWNSRELEIPYEDIAPAPLREQQFALEIMAMLGVLLLLAMGNILGFIEGPYSGIKWVVAIGSSAGLYYLYQSGRAMLYLGKGEPESLEFFNDETHRAETEPFVRALLTRQKDFLLDKYWYCVDDTYQKKDYLEWLKNRQIIDLSAFKAMQSELPKPAQPIGFHHS